MHFPLSVLLLSKCISGSVERVQKWQRKACVELAAQDSQEKMCRVKLQVDGFFIKKMMSFCFPWRMAHLWEGSKGQRKEGGKGEILEKPICRAWDHPLCWAWGWGMWDCVRMCVHCPAALLFVCGRGTQKENRVYWIKNEWLDDFGIWGMFWCCVWFC